MPSPPTRRGPSWWSRTRCWSGSPSPTTCAAAATGCWRPEAAAALVILGTGEAVELVFSDVQMPGATDGFGLARWVREHRPGVDVILTSGMARKAEKAGDLCGHGPCSGNRTT